MAKKRLDLLLFERSLAPSRSKAAAMIMAAEVTVDERLVDKPGAQVAESATIRLKAKRRYASRGGIKLEAALKAFAMDVTGKICADVGASTGGFTDCLLQAGAARVHAIDVGAGLLVYRLRQDKRVRLWEKTNARYLESLGETVDLVTIDVSFISLRLILPAVRGWLDEDAAVIALVKPQFEARKADIGKGGIVKDPRVRQGALNKIAEFANDSGFSIRGLIESPIRGAKGNIEYLLWLGPFDANAAIDHQRAIAELFHASPTRPPQSDA